MTYNTTVTSKGQLTLSVAFRKKLNIKPGERLKVELDGDKVIIQKSDWRSGLAKLQKDVAEHMKTKKLKTPTLSQLDAARKQTWDNQMKRHTENS